MYLELVSKSELAVTVKDGMNADSVKQVRIPWKSTGLLDLPWGRCSAKQLFFKARNTRNGAVIHLNDK